MSTWIEASIRSVTFSNKPGVLETKLMAKPTEPLYSNRYAG